VRGPAAEVVADRRDLHAHPETAWTEFRTTARVVQRLRALGYRVRYGREVVREQARMGVPEAAALEAAWERAAAEGADPALLEAMRGGFTGCVGELEGAAGPGPTVALRFDIDALPVTEADAAAGHRPAREGFASRHPGAMHACGHDGHTAMGLGVAAALAAARARMAGRVRLVFQPAEEGTRGAAAMVAAGVLEGVQDLLCVHLGAQSHVSGEVLPGVTGFLATTKLDAEFLGKEAHAGLAPEEGRSALVAAAFAAVGLHALPRHSEGNSRVNVGVLRAGSGRNVVAGQAQLLFELRGETTAVVDYLERQAAAVVAGAAAMYGVEHRLRRAGAAPSASSDPALMALVARVAEATPGVRRVGEPCRAGASDDAATMMAAVQAAGGRATYVIIGSELPSGHHTPRFDIDEAVLPIGVGVLAGTALELLGAHP
jgi:aminobenzoyl-glutamate utilization protein A